MLLLLNLLSLTIIQLLKPTAKEPNKLVLKELISVSFVALIQTIKADPQMVNLIQNMTTTNDREHNKDNNNNITKYLESNKDRILDLAEKHYENLVKALTNNAIDDAATAASSYSFNPTLSLPQSSTFPERT